MEWLRRDQNRCDRPSPGKQEGGTENVAFRVFLLFFFFFSSFWNAVKSLSYWYSSISGKGMSRRNGWDATGRI